MPTKPSEILQVVAGELKPTAVGHLPALRAAAVVGGQVPPLGIRANADQPDQAETRTRSARAASGCAGPSTCSSAKDGIPIVQRMILADNEKDRRAALDELLPLQRGDFYGVFKAMHGDAGDDPDDRSAAPRVPAEARGPDGRDRANGDEQGRKGRSSTRRRSCCAASSSSTSSIRCSVIAASASASRTRRSPRCRRAPSSRRPASSRKRRTSRSCRRS